MDLDDCNRRVMETIVCARSVALESCWGMAGFVLCWLKELHGYFGIRNVE